MTYLLIGVGLILAWLAYSLCVASARMDRAIQALTEARDHREGER